MNKFNWNHPSSESEGRIKFNGFTEFSTLALHCQLWSLYFFPIKDSTPQSTYECEFNHVSELKSLCFCSNEAKGRCWDRQITKFGFALMVSY